MEPPKITRISLLYLPFGKPNSYQVMVNTTLYDKTRHRLVIQVATKVYELPVNTITIILPQKPENSSPIAAFLPPNNDLRIKAYIYDFISDKIIEAKLQEFGYQAITQAYMPNDELLITLPVIMGLWKKDKTVIKVEGPFGIDGKLVTTIKQGESYTFKATPNQSLLSIDLLTIKWSYKYDNGEKIPFQHQQETTKSNQNQITCSFPKGIKVSNITVYAYFVKESEKVAIKTKVFNNKIEKIETSSDADNKVKNGDYVKITIDQIEELFGKYKKYHDFRQEIIDNFNKYNELAIIKKKPLHIDTPLRKAHFFAQVGAETLGINPDWMVETDVFKYSVKSAKVFGSRAEKLESLNLLQTYCDEKPQKKLLNYVYAQENGKGNGNGNEASGDGYKFRGRGLKQITGKDNYKIASQYIKEIFPDQYIDLVENPDKAKEPKYAVLSAIAFWEKNNIWKVADTISEPKDKDIQRIRSLVNGTSTAWKDVKKYFEKGLVVFNESQKETPCKVDNSQCVNYSDIWDDPEISSDNGGKNNNRFGYNSSRGHKGIDILTGPKYKNVHSLMCGEVVSLVNSFKTNEYKASSLGNTLMIKSKDKDNNLVYILYCHLDEIYVKKGDKIKHGEIIALSGSTGNASSDEFPNGKKGHGIKKEFWHCHIEAATKGEGYNNYYSLGKYRIKAEDFMKTKFDKDGNSIK